MKQSLNRIILAGCFFAAGWTGQAQNFGIPTTLEKERVVVASEDCCLSAGNQSLCQVPARTVLVVEAEQQGYVNVAYNGMMGWIALQKCFRLGRNPGDAEDVCRKGLTELSQGNFFNGRAKLFCAMAMEPNDNSYSEIYEFATFTFNQLDRGRALYQKSLQTMKEAEDKSDTAAFLGSGGFSNDSTLADSRRRSMNQKLVDANRRQNQAESLFNESNSIAEEIRRNLVKKIEGWVSSGQYAAAVAFYDLIGLILKDSNYSYVSRGFGSDWRRNMDDLRKVIADSNASFAAGQEEIKKRKYLTASRHISKALEIWKENKKAVMIQRQVKDITDRLEKAKKRIDEAIAENNLAELENLVAEVSSLTTDFEGLEGLVKETKKTLEASRLDTEEASKALGNGHPWDAYFLALKALSRWATNIDALQIRKRASDALDKDLALAAKIEEHEKGQDYESALKTLRDLVSRFPSEHSLGEMIVRLEKLDAERKADYAKARQMEESFKLGEAWELFKKRAFYDDAKRVAGELGKFFEEQHKPEQAVAFYDEAGRTEDASRLRKKHHVIGDVAASYRELSGQEIYERNEKKVCFVAARSMYGFGFGSGFLISKNGYIVTNNHVVKGANLVLVKFPGEKEFRKAAIIRTLSVPDLALLQIPVNGLNIEPASVGKIEPKPGAKVFALGYPDVKIANEDDATLHSTFTEGVVSNNQREVNGNSCLQTTTSINHGNSGGPLFDANGNVVGVNTFGLHPAIGVQSVFFAIKVSEIYKYLPIEENKMASKMNH
ncbi:MAG: trypsin-like peptidase domain-containing protein [Verrucomicrobiae bacterium]|nr:trypsin-like peptidase domain-containing protein [Verrucomicrobiae bacterium]